MILKKQKLITVRKFHTLIELLDNIPNCFFNIDCKSDDTVIPLIEVIKKFSLFDRVCIGSFSQKRINFIRESLGSKVKTSMGPSEILMAKVLSNFPINRFFESTYASLPIRRYGIELLNKKEYKFFTKK